jgi:hypothetical protein
MGNEDAHGQHGEQCLGVFGFQADFVLKPLPLGHIHGAADHLDRLALVIFEQHRPVLDV